MSAVSPAGRQKVTEVIRRLAGQAGRDRATALVRLADAVEAGSMCPREALRFARGAR